MFCMVMAMVDSPDDKDKVKKLYNKYNKLMLYVSNGILHNPADVEDAVMTAWERILKNLNKISEISCPETKSFVVTVIERISIDIYRKNTRIRDKEAPIDAFEDSPFFATADKEMASVEIRDAINRAGILGKLYKKGEEYWLDWSDENYSYDIDSEGVDKPEITVKRMAESIYQKK